MLRRQPAEIRGPSLKRRVDYQDGLGLFVAGAEGSLAAGAPFGFNGGWTLPFALLLALTVRLAKVVFPDALRPITGLEQPKLE